MHIAYHGRQVRASDDRKELDSEAILIDTAPSELKCTLFLLEQMARLFVDRRFLIALTIAAQLGLASLSWP